MLKQHAKMVSWFLMFSDVLVTSVSFVMSYWIRSTYRTSWDLGGLRSVDSYYWLLFVILPAWVYFLSKNEAYRSYRTASFLEEIKALSKSVVLGGIFIGAIVFISKSAYVSRTFILVFVIVNLLMLILERFIIRRFASVIRRRGYNYRNILIIGTDEVALDIAQRIERYNHWGLRIIGFLGSDNTVTDTKIEKWPVLGKFLDLQRIVTENVVDEVIFAVTGRRLDDLEDALLMLEDHGIKAHIVANIFPHIIAKLHLDELETVQLLTFTTTPTDMTALFIKRILDILVGFVLLIFTLPVMAATAMIIKITSPGPVFFKQKRSGLYGRTFTLYKFRSMSMDAEARKKALEDLNEMDGPVFKIKDDPRITKIGRFIRKASIDELPQLWNVLKGDMSIVGPRPPIPDEVGHYDRWQRRRLSMRPGLTCLWQISGRSRLRRFDDWVKLDLQYIDTWSLALDLKIFLKTIPVVLFRKGAS